MESKNGSDIVFLVLFVLGFFMKYVIVIVKGMKDNFFFVIVVVL